MTYSVQKRYVTPGKCRRPPLPDWALATYSLLGHVASWAVDPIGYALSEGSKRGTGASPRATTCGWGPVGDRAAAITPTAIGVSGRPHSLAHTLPELRPCGGLWNARVEPECVTTISTAITLVISTLKD